MPNVLNEKIHSDIYDDAKKRIPSQKEQVLSTLQYAGCKGVTNIELNEICFRYGAIMFDLKLEGYQIITENIGEGIVNYTLLKEKGAKVQYKKGIDVITSEINDKYNGFISTKELVALLDLHNLNLVRKPNCLNKKVN